MGLYRTLINIIHLPLGIVDLVVFCLAGIILCITIIGIPLGKFLFKAGKFLLWPANRELVRDDRDKSFCNILFIIFFGWWLAIIMLIMAAICYITIILWPLGQAYWQLAKACVTASDYHYVSRDSVAPATSNTMT